MPAASPMLNAPAARNASATHVPRRAASTPPRAHDTTLACAEGETHRTRDVDPDSRLTGRAGNAGRAPATAEIPASPSMSRNRRQPTGKQATPARTHGTALTRAEAASAPTRHITPPAAHTPSSSTGTGITRSPVLRHSRAHTEAASAQARQATPRPAHTPSIRAGADTRPLHSAPTPRGASFPAALNLRPVPRPTASAPARPTGWSRPRAVRSGRRPHRSGRSRAGAGSCVRSFPWCGRR